MLLVLRLAGMQSPEANGSLLGTAIVAPLSQVIQGKAIIVRVANGSVLPLGLGALLRAVQEAGCAHGSTAHSRPQGIDLWSADIAQPQTFAYLTTSLRDGGLNCLRLIRLCGLGLVDEQITQLSCAMGRHPCLEILSVPNNKMTSSAGVLLFDSFVSLPRARALDLSCNPLGDAMAHGIVGRLSSGSPWNLQALWFAYCSLTQAGLNEFARIVRAGADSLEHLVLSGRKDNSEEWETLAAACLDNAIKLRVLPDLQDAAHMSIHIIDEMTQAAVYRAHRNLTFPLLGRNTGAVEFEHCILSRLGACTGKSKSESLAAAFMSYFDEFRKRKEENGGVVHGRTESSTLDRAWQDAMQIMDTMRNPVDMRSNRF